MIVVYRGKPKNAFNVFIITLIHAETGKSFNKNIQHSPFTIIVLDCRVIVGQQNSDICRWYEVVRMLQWMIKTIK